MHMHHGRPECIESSKLAMRDKIIPLANAYATNYVLVGIL